MFQAIQQVDLFWKIIYEIYIYCRHEISSRAECTRASRKGLLDGAVDPPSFNTGVVDPTYSSQDMLVNLTL